MEPNDMLYADPLDILFENRNKSYGAYPLRKFYAQRMYISMGVMFSLVLVLILLYLKFQTIPLTVTTFTIPDPIIGNYDPPHPVKPIPQPVRPAAPRIQATVQLTTPLIVSQTDPKPIANIDELNKSVIGTTTTTGTPDNGLPSGNGNSTAGTAPAKLDSTEAAGKIWTSPELMPEFPGGIEALKRFLLKNLRMPDEGSDAESETRVVARFVVSADGKVREIEIVQAAGEAYNKEVKRVILKMPDWKPGMQNHHAVAVYFNLPVNFVSRD